MSKAAEGALSGPQGFEPAYDCDHASMDGVGYGDLWVCMQCARLCRTEPADDPRFTRTVALGPTETLAAIDRIRRPLLAAESVVEYVSMGRGWIGTRPYPDASARKVNAEIKEALSGRR